MTKNDELLQRCLDGELNDEEMKQLFFEMSNDEALRKQFRSFQSLRRGLQTIPIPSVPIKLDEKIKRLSLTPQIKRSLNKSVMEKVLSKKLSFSMPAFVGTALLLLLGSYFAATKIIPSRAETEFVYIMQLPQVEVHAVIN